MYSVFVTNSFDQPICNKIYEVRNILIFYSISRYFKYYFHTNSVLTENDKPILILRTLIQRVQARFALKGASRASVLVRSLQYSEYLVH